MRFKILMAGLLCSAATAGVVGAWFWNRGAAAWAVDGEAAMERLGAKVAPAGDVNGDGFADLAVWAENHDRSRGKIYVYLGSARGPSATPAFVQAGEGPVDQYGHSFGGMGDVNGDTVDDFLVAAQNHGDGSSVSAGKAYLYLGGPAGPVAPAAWTRVGARGDLFGDCSGPAGDVNRDGLADVIIGAYGHDRGRGRAHIFLGSPAGLSEKPHWSVYGEKAGDWFGYSVAQVGDLNGDGHPEIAIGAKNAGKGSLSSVGKAYVYCGSPTGPSTRPCWTAAGEANGDFFGWRAVGAGDVNGDGYADLAVSAYKHSGPGGPSSGSVSVYCGSARGLSQTPCWTHGGGNAAAFFGISIGGGDFDRDGYADLLVGCPGCLPKSRLLLFSGGPEGLSAVPAWSMEGEGDGGAFGSYVSNVGDVNGDGHPDALVGAPSHSQAGRQWTGRAYLLYGRADKALGRRPAGL